MAFRTVSIFVLLLAVVGGGTALAIRTNSPEAPVTFVVSGKFSIDITSDWFETTVPAITPDPRDPGEAELRPVVALNHPAGRTIAIFPDDSGDDMEAVVEAWAARMLGEPETRHGRSDGLDVWFLSSNATGPGRTGSVHAAVVRLDEEPSVAWIVTCSAREANDEECPRILGSIRRNP